MNDIDENINEALQKRLMVLSLVAFGVPGYQFAEEMVRLGLATFTGNQHNENWKWEKEELEKLPFAQLKYLFLIISEHQAVL